jgi:hypothetical protein
MRIGPSPFTSVENNQYIRIPSRESNTVKVSGEKKSRQYIALSVCRRGADPPKKRTYQEAPGQSHQAMSTQSLPEAPNYRNPLKCGLVTSRIQILRTRSQCSSVAMMLSAP